MSVGAFGTACFVWLGHRSGTKAGRHHDAAPQGFRLIAGRAYPSERILPFGLWIGTLRASGVLDDPDAIETIGTPWRRELARLFPELGARGAARSGLDDHLRIFAAVAELSRRSPGVGRTSSSSRISTGRMTRASAWPPSSRGGWPGSVLLRLHRPRRGA